MTDPGTPTWLRTHNDRTALRLLLAHGPLSRSQLGELSGLSKPTAGQMIQRLQQVGLIEPVGEVMGNRGPNAIAYGVRRDSLTGVAISILDKSIQAVLVDPTDADHEVVVLRTVGKTRSPAIDVVAAVDAACRAAGVGRDSVSVVAIGVQAAVEPNTDRLSFTDTLPGWPSQGARARIEEATGLTVILENDVNLATMAERAVAVSADVVDFAYLWLGVGIGAGIDVGGVVQRGASGGAGEIGYLEVPRSAMAIAPNAHDYTDLLGGPAVVELMGGTEAAELESLLPRLAENAELMGNLADRIAIVLETLTAVLDPGLFVLGGPTARAGGQRLAELVQQRMVSDRPGVDVRTSGTSDQPVLLGARRLLVDTIRERLEDRITTS
jgi:predicted NBD/HSP70 family sugar kinase